MFVLINLAQKAIYRVIAQTVFAPVDDKLRSFCETTANSTGGTKIARDRVWGNGIFRDRKQATLWQMKKFLEKKARFIFF